MIHKPICDIYLENLQTSQIRPIGRNLFIEAAGDFFEMNVRFPLSTFHG